jgi:hypothetical protein
MKECTYTSCRPQTFVRLKSRIVFADISPAVALHLFSSERLVTGPSGLVTGPRGRCKVWWMLRRTMSPLTLILRTATAVAQKALGHGFQNVWVESTPARHGTNATDYRLFEEESYLGGLLPVGRTERGLVRLAFRHTDDLPDPDRNTQMRECGDPDVKGNYAVLEGFYMPESYGKDPAPVGRVLETAALLTARVWKEMEARGVNYVEGDICDGEYPMFAACGWDAHKYRRLPATGTPSLRRRANASA